MHVGGSNTATDDNRKDCRTTTACGHYGRSAGRGRLRTAMAAHRRRPRRRQPCARRPRRRRPQVTQATAAGRALPRASGDPAVAAKCGSDATRMAAVARKDN
ncbi:hypothetical protein BHM03_00042432 [Ensete ventricosum]|nr:hypothetical protein BHM03_00042432 [Ensete ventricosum]